MVCGFFLKYLAMDGSTSKKLLASLRDVQARVHSQFWSLCRFQGFYLTNSVMWVSIGKATSCLLQSWDIKKLTLCFCILPVPRNELSGAGGC